MYLVGYFMQGLVFPIFRVGIYYLECMFQLPHSDHLIACLPGIAVVGIPATAAVAMSAVGELVVDVICEEVPLPLVVGQLQLLEGVGELAVRYPFAGTAIFATITTHKVLH